jgi:hypothetical protein
MTAGASPADADRDRATSQLTRARELIKEALDLLDKADAPPEIGAHVQAALDAIDALS